ncbi:hypothetical protein OH492_13995 [Vibrio chagasii]|nr:hypothetical protein [Vibrio chagasii]
MMDATNCSWPSSFENAAVSLTPLETNIRLSTVQKSLELKFNKELQNSRCTAELNKSHQLASTIVGGAINEPNNWPHLTWYVQYGKFCNRYQPHSGVGGFALTR